MEDEFGEFTDGTASAGHGTGQVDHTTETGMPVGGCGGEADQGEERFVIFVVSDKGGLFGREVEFPEEMLERDGFVAAALEEKVNVHFFGAVFHDPGVFGGDDSHADAVFPQTAETDSVPGIEFFELVPVFTVVHSRVGEHAIDICEKKADGLKAFPERCFLRGGALQQECFHDGPVGGFVEFLIGFRGHLIQGDFSVEAALMLKQTGAGCDVEGSVFDKMPIEILAARALFGEIILRVGQTVGGASPEEPVLRDGGEQCVRA